MSEALKKVTEALGIDILKDVDLFKSAIADFLPGFEYEQERLNLCMCVQAGIGKKLLNAKCSLASKTVRSDCMEMLKKTYGGTDQFQLKLLDGFVNIFFITVAFYYLGNLFERSCDSKMQYALGERHYHNKDYLTAVKWYRKSASQGHAEAQYRLGHCYYNGLGVIKSYSKAVTWFRRAARQGYAVASFLLGECYRSGIGVEKNCNKAVKWFIKAFEQDNSFWNNKQVCKAIGLLYYYETSIERDYTTIIRLLKGAADDNDVEAQFVLGLCYGNNNCPVRNYNEAMKWYHKSAECGYVKAQLLLSKCYIDGVGVKQNLIESAKWYEKAIEQDSSVLDKRLCKLYGDLYNFNKNYNEASKWYYRAGCENLGKP